MSFLAALLTVKIAVILPAIVAPLLVADTKIMNRILGGQTAALMYRLYGVAWLALVVGCAFALLAHVRGDPVEWIVPVGFTSTAGAAVLLGLNVEGRVGVISTGFFGSMALGFLAVWVWPEDLARFVK